MNKIEFIKALEREDFKHPDWVYNLLSKLNDLYARGYMSKYVDDYYSKHDDDEYLISHLLIISKTYNIWNKQQNKES